MNKYTCIYIHRCIYTYLYSILVLQGILLIVTYIIYIYLMYLLGTFLFSNPVRVRRLRLAERRKLRDRFQWRLEIVGMPQLRSWWNWPPNMAVVRFHQKFSVDLDVEVMWYIMVYYQCLAILRVGFWMDFGSLDHGDLDGHSPHIPSGKHRKRWNITIRKKGKSTIFMAIFNSKL